MAAENPLGQWREWHARCALGLCGAEAQDGLRSFAQARFAHCLSHHGLPGYSSEGAGDMTARDAWHLFETHVGLRSTGGGLPYKQWLFARTSRSDDPPLDVIQGGASLIMRDVVREWLRSERHPPGTQSLDAPLGGAYDSGLTLQDLLPGSLDPVDEVARREFEELAGRYAASAARELSPRERLVLLSKASGMALTDPRLALAAGRSKTTLHEAYRNVVERVASRIRADCGADDRESALLLTRMTLERLKQMLLDEEKTGNREG